MTRLELAPSDLEIVDAYLHHGSVHKAGAALGISHSRVHRRLQALGASKPMNIITESDRQAIETYYLTTPKDLFDLDVLVKTLGRTKQLICRTAGEMGLTSPTRPMSLERKIRKRVPRPEGWVHPRGALGMKHSDETKAKLSEASRSFWLVQKTFGIGNMSPENIQKRSDRMSQWRAESPAENAYTRTKGGVRADVGGMYFRSSWEANYARYLNWLVARGEIDRWEYEPETFWFLEIKRGVRSYKPDFKIFEKGKFYFVEVKGWMDPKSATKLKRMKKYHPSIRVDLVGAKQYAQIKEKLSRIIAGWE